MSAYKILPCGKGLIFRRQRRICLAVFHIAGRSEQICVLLRLCDYNAVPRNHRRVVLAPLAGIAVEKEQNAALAVITGRFVIKRKAAAFSSTAVSRAAS